MPLISALVAQVCWAGLLWLLFIILFLGNITPGTTAFFLLATANVIFSLVALSKRRWAVVVNLAFVVLFLGLTLPNVVLNTAMFILGHELYRDSPGTIFIVAIYAVVLVLPAVIVCVFYVLSGIELFALLRGRPVVSRIRKGGGEKGMSRMPLT